MISQLIMIITLVSIWLSLVWSLVTLSSGVHFWLKHSDFKVDTSPLESYPMVTIVVPAHNEDVVIAQTTRAILDMNYPHDKVELLLFADNCEDTTYQEMLKEIKKNSEKYGITDDVVAILITRPDLATGKDILNSLEYYHFRTGHSINFYLPGYGAYWTEEEYPDGKVVTEIASVKWSFSNQRFVEFIEDMEKYSKWRYSGESDLIFAEVKNGRLSYERAMEFHLDNMLRDKAIISVNQFFEKIVRIGQEGRSMNQIGNKLGIDKGKQVVFDALLEKMPMHMGDVIKQEKYFCVKNIQK